MGPHLACMSKQGSIRAYARHRGCDEKSVRNAIKAGRITKESDGTIDPDKADAQWEANTNRPSNRGNRKVRRKGDDEELLPVPNAAIEQVRQTVGTNGDSVTLLEARVAKTIADAHQSHLKAMRMDGALIDRIAAERFVFAWYRQLRDTLVSWPARVSAVLASDLGIEQADLHALLESHVHDLCTDLAAIEPERLE